VRADDVEETIEHYLGEHICRCTGYVRYYQAAKDLIMTTPGLVNPISEPR
jgi:aerobic-type carbon monoxide dehydrogenase small subunit (CoxS/CutS family)